MTAKRIDPHTPLMTVLDAALAAVSADSRFRCVPNGRVEVAWLQPRKGEDASPARYRVSFECDFAPAPPEETTR